MIKEIQMEAVFIGEKNVITKNVNLSKTWPLFTLILPKYVNISPFYKYKWKNADNFFKKFAFPKHAQITVASLIYLHSTRPRTHKTWPKISFYECWPYRRPWQKSQIKQQRFLQMFCTGKKMCKTYTIHGPNSTTLRRSMLIQKICPQNKIWPFQTTIRPQNSKR